MVFLSKHLDYPFPPLGILVPLISLAILSGFLLAHFSPLPATGSIAFFLLVLPLSWFFPQGAFLLFVCLLITDQTIQIATIDFWLAEFLAIPILVFWLVRMLLAKGTIPKVAFTVPIVLFSVLTFVNVAYTTDVTEGLGVFRKELGAILLCFVLISMKLSIRSIGRIVNALIIVCVFSCLVAILQNFTGSFAFSGVITQRGYLSLLTTRQLSWVRNANGFFAHFNTFGGFAAQILPLPLSLALYSPERNRRWHLIFFSVIAFGLLLSYSRGALMAATAAVIVIWYPKVKTRLVSKLLFFIASGLAIYAASVILFQTEYLYLTQRLAPRMRIWGIILDNVLQHFWAGTGLASMMDIITASVSSGPIIASHNNYLTLLLERGVLGFSLFVLIVVIFFKSSFRVNKLARTKDNQRARILGLGLTGSMIVFLVHSAVDHFYSGFSFKVLFFMYIALIVSLEQLLRVQKSGGANETQR